MNEHEDRCGRAVDSIVCSGSIVSGAEVDHSVVGANARIHSYAKVEDCILFDHVEVGRGARLRRVIVDKGVKLPAGVEIGYDNDFDRARGFQVTESGIVVIAKDDGPSLEASSAIDREAIAGS